MSVIQSELPANFLGAKPGVQYELTNGQVWAQAEDVRRFSYAYRPVVRIWVENGEHVMHVCGADQKIRVLRIK
jgi:hypothetical protein